MGPPLGQEEARQVVDEVFQLEEDAVRTCVHKHTYIMLAQL